MRTEERVRVGDRQRRTLDELVRARERPLPAGAIDAIRERLAAAVADAPPARSIFLTKARLTAADRCEGRFHAAILGEGPPFEHGPKTAAGLLMHRAIELDVGGREERDAHPLVELAAQRLEEEDTAFAAFVRGLDPVGVDELLMRAMGALVLFRETFPPLREMRSELAPLTEWPLRAEVARGALVLHGRVDLAVGRRPPDGDGRVLIDLKGEGAWPEHAEDMRFYALVHALRFDAPPARVATFFLASGEWQLEDVTARTLDRAADRVVRSAGIQLRLEDGGEPSLTPGRYCAWCPRRAECPSAG